MPDTATTTGDGDSARPDSISAFGLSESEAASRLARLPNAEVRPQVTLTVEQSIVTGRLMHGSGSDRHELDGLLKQIEQAWHPWSFGRGDSTLAGAVGDLLRRQRQTLTTAESCTGGMLGSMIVDIPGSSDYYLGGWVTYSNAMKISELGVSQELLQEHGAVSQPVAAAMACGSLDRHAHADYALAITGIAGPGGTPHKPAGLVYIGIGQRSAGGESFARVRRFQFTGDRAEVRTQSALAALQMLRWQLIGCYDTTVLKSEQAAVSESTQRRGDRRGEVES